MIPVSSEFKKAIKDRERRIKGYVEVLYDAPNVNVEVEVVNMTSANTNPSEISNGIRVENDYGTVDYLPLDGSKLVMGDTNINSGFISDMLAEETMGIPYVTLSFQETTINGLTLYYRDNYPNTTTIQIQGEELITINDEGYVQQIVFNEPKTLSQITVLFKNWEYPKRKIKIMEIDLGITQTYKDQDLLEFTVDEEVNKLVEETPTNEVDITLNNMQDLFNPLNPQGIVRFLTENVKIIPYIGVLTENNGVEYVKMGEFLFESYTNNSDKSTTLVGKNLMKQLETEILKDDNETDFFKQNSFLKQDMENFMQNYNYDIDFSGFNKYGFTMSDIKDTKLIESLRSMSLLNSNLLYFNRNSVLNLISINKNINEIITKNELINDASFKNMNKSNILKVIGYSGPAEYYEQPKDVYQANITLDKSPKIVLCDVGDATLFYQPTVSQSGGTSASIISHSYYLAFVKITGTLGSNVSITIKSNYLYKPHEYFNEYDYSGQNSQKNIMEITPIPSPQGYSPDSVLKDSPSYEMSFEYNGDPSLEAGDYINVETPYGYKKLFIQKNRFTFNGGLTGSIEGVE